MIALMMKRTFLALVAVASSLAACATNPVTGKSQLALISEQQELAMGKEGDAQVVASIGLYDDQDLQRYVQQLGAGLAGKSERPGLPWTFRVVDDAAVNAFALPGGYIYVTRGILTHLSSEAELAAVLGHEIGHVTARHSVSQLSKQQLAGLGLGLAMILSPEARPYGDLAQAGLGVLFLKFGRKDESQADQLGFRYIVDSGYDPRPMGEVFSVLESVTAGSGQGRLPSWLSTHPDPANRRQWVEAEVVKTQRDVSAGKVARNPYLRRIDGIVFGDDPREGFFTASTFHHPELRFRVDFPSGWKGENQKQAVGAISSNRDAMVVLELAAERSAEEAARHFFAQQGIEVGQEWRDRINGLRAVSYAFGARTQNGDLRGVAGWVEYGERVYQLLGYTSAARWSQHRDAILESLSSFGRETDRAVLEVQPKRLRMVELESGGRTEDLVRRYPSTVPAATLALINHLSPGETMPRGDLFKRVVGGPPPGR